MSDILESCILCTIWICTLNFGKKTWGSYRYHMALYRTMWWNCLLFPHFFGRYYIWPKFNTHHEEYVYYQRPNIGCLPGKPACWVVEYDFCPWTAQHDDWSKFDNILRIGNILGLSGDLYSNGDVFMGIWPIPKYVLYGFFGQNQTMKNWNNLRGKGPCRALT